MFSPNSLTSRQEEILNFLKEFRHKGRSAPTYREIAEHFGFKSTKAATDHISALEKKGYLRRHSGKSRGIELLTSENMSTSSPVSVPLLGEIPAGSPEELAEELQDTITVDRTLLQGATGHRLFALKVKGESMLERGINDGDCVIADADVSPRKGNIVVALIDGENTLKTLAIQNGKIYLKSENPKYSDWMPVKEMVIQGVVRTVLRQIF